MDQLNKRLGELEIVIADAMKMANDPDKFWNMAEMVTNKIKEVTLEMRELTSEDRLRVTRKMMEIQKPYSDFLKRIVQ